MSEHGLPLLWFARPSMIEGFGRIFDFGDTLTVFNRAMTPDQADFIALWSDWAHVGADLDEATERWIEAHGDLVEA